MMCIETKYLVNCLNALNCIKHVDASTMASFRCRDNYYESFGTS